MIEYSSAPISGFVASRISPSISVVMFAIGFPVPSPSSETACKLVSDRKYGFTENEFASCPETDCQFAIFDLYPE